MRSGYKVVGVSATYGHEESASQRESTNQRLPITNRLSADPPGRHPLKTSADILGFVDLLAGERLQADGELHPDGLPESKCLRYGRRFWIRITLAFEQLLRLRLLPAVRTGKQAGIEHCPYVPAKSVISMSCSARSHGYIPASDDKFSGLWYDTAATVGITGVAEREVHLLEGSGSRFAWLVCLLV